MSNIKIFVTYSNTPNCIDSINEHNGMHPEFLKQKNKYIPILGGASSYNGKNNFLKSIMRDDTGKDNISHLNININEHSVIYWASRNLKSVSNPEYIGFCHYRRLIDCDESKLSKSTIFVNILKTGIPISTYAMINHAPDMMRLFTEFTYKFIRHSEVDERNLFIKWLSQDVLFAQNLFIIHRDLFVEFENDIVKAISILLQSIYQFPNIQDRNAGFILERFTGFVLYKLALKYGLEVQPLKYEILDSANI